MVCKEIANAESLCVTADVWTESHTTTAYLGVTVHYRRRTELVSVVAGVEPLSESHTAIYLADRLMHFCKNWNIDTKKVEIAVTDNAENIKLAVKSVFGADRCIPCFAHTLNLVPALALGTKTVQEKGIRREIVCVPGVPEVLNKIRSVVTFSHQSVNFSDMLKNAQLARGKSDGTCLRLIQDVKTRWGSTYEMLERFLELSEVIGGIVTKYPSLVMLTGAEMATVKSFMEILRPIHLATKEMSGEKYTTISRIIPLIYILKKVWAKPTPWKKLKYKVDFCLSFT